MSTVAAGERMAAEAAGTNRIVVSAAEIVTAVVGLYSFAAVATTAVKNNPVAAEVVAREIAVSTAYWSIAGVAADYTVTERTKVVGRSRTESPWPAGSAGSAPVRSQMWASGNLRCAVDEDLEKPSASS